MRVGGPHQAGIVSAQAVFIDDRMVKEFCRIELFPEKGIINLQSFGFFPSFRSDVQVYLVHLVMAVGAAKELQ